MQHISKEYLSGFKYFRLLKFKLIIIARNEACFSNYFAINLLFSPKAAANVMLYMDKMF